MRRKLICFTLSILAAILVLTVFAGEAMACGGCV